MFTGIIEQEGIIEKIENDGSNRNFWIRAPFVNELSIGQSVAHNGVCLTVAELNNNIYKVTAVDETLKRSNLGSLIVLDPVNLERCTRVDGRFDGHIVQGHVDDTAICTFMDEKDGSRIFGFQCSENHTSLLMVEKGSICINGISLTVFGIERNNFTVAIIPHTYDHTNFKKLQTGDRVNIEFDVVGKYIINFLKNRGT